MAIMAVNNQQYKIGLLEINVPVYKWLLLLSFIPLCIVTDWDGQYLPYIGLCFFMTIILLRSCTSMSTATPSLIIMFILIIACFIKPAILFSITDKETLIGAVGEHIWPLMESDTLRLKTIENVAWGYTVFCLTATVCLWVDCNVLARAPKLTIHSILNYNTTKSICIIMIMVAIFLSIILAYIQLLTNVGVTGIQITLPFRLAGLIVHGRTVFIPYIIIIISWLADRSGLRGVWWFAIIIMILHALSVSLIMGAKAEVFREFIPFFVLWFITRSYDRRKILVVIISVVLAALTYNFFAQLRIERIMGGSIRPIGEAISDTFTQPQKFRLNDDQTQSVLFSFMAIPMRVAGFEQMVLVIARCPETFDLNRCIDLLFYGQTNFAVYYVENIEGRGMLKTPHGTSPGIMGELYALFGKVGMLVGIMLWVILSYLMWEIINHLVVYTRPLAQSIYMLFIGLMTSEGAIEGIPLNIMLLAISIISAELIFKMNIPIPRRDYNNKTSWV